MALSTRSSNFCNRLVTSFSGLYRRCVGGQLLRSHPPPVPPICPPTPGRHRRFAPCALNSSLIRLAMSPVEPPKSVMVGMLPSCQPQVGDLLSPASCHPRLYVRRCQAHCWSSPEAVSSHTLQASARRMVGNRCSQDLLLPSGCKHPSILVAVLPVQLHACELGRYL